MSEVEFYSKLAIVPKHFEIGRSYNGKRVQE